jgi:two-component system response regulator RpfG
LRHGGGTHLVRTARFAALIAERLGLSNEAVRRLELAAPLHDIGMLSVPDAILDATGALDEAQIRTLREHARNGAELLRHGTDPVLCLAGVLALSHHERWDGTGYPHALRGAEIPLEERILALADVFEALISPRPQRAAWSLDAAVEYVRDQSGRAFDPACVRAMLSDRESLMAISRMKFSETPAQQPREQKRRA